MGTGASFWVPTRLALQETPESFISKNFVSFDSPLIQIYKQNIYFGVDPQYSWHVIFRKIFITSYNIKTSYYFPLSRIDTTDLKYVLTFSIIVQSFSSTQKCLTLQTCQTCLQNIKPSLSLQSRICWNLKGFRAFPCLKRTRRYWLYPIRRPASRSSCTLQIIALAVRATLGPASCSSVQVSPARPVTC